MFGIHDMLIDLVAFERFFFTFSVLKILEKGTKAV